MHLMLDQYERSFKLWGVVSKGEDDAKPSRSLMCRRWWYGPQRPVCVSLGSGHWPPVLASVCRKVCPSCLNYFQVIVD